VAVASLGPLRAGIAESTPMHTPESILRAGVAILDGVLTPHRFRFEFRDDGVTRGGRFAWGEYVRDERRLALHFRHALGVVTYHLGDAQASHEGLARALGYAGRNAYPGFSDEPLDAFRHLRQDLEAFGSAFLQGGKTELRSLLDAAAQLDAGRPKGLKAFLDSQNT
jgi:hypothetical protein